MRTKKTSSCTSLTWAWIITFFLCMMIQFKNAYSSSYFMSRMKTKVWEIPKLKSRFFSLSNDFFFIVNAHVWESVGWGEFRYEERWLMLLQQKWETFNYFSVNLKLFFPHLVWSINHRIEWHFDDKLFQHIFTNLLIFFMLSDSKNSGIDKKYLNSATFTCQKCDPVLDSFPFDF